MTGTSRQSPQHAYVFEIKLFKAIARPFVVATFHCPLHSKPL